MPPVQKPATSVSGRRETFEATQQGLFGPTPVAPAKATLWPPAGFTPPAGGWPTDLRARWDKLYDFRTRPGYPNQLPPETQDFYNQFLQPYERFTPPKGTPLSPEFQKQVPNMGEFSFLEDFNLGPQMASAPLGEGAASPWAPIAGWQPAQAEEWGV